MELTVELVERALELLPRGGCGEVRYSNFSLVGHQNVPTEMIAAAVLYPLAVGSQYAIVAIDPRGDGKRDEFRSRILEAVIPERVEMMQAEMDEIRARVPGFLVEVHLRGVREATHGVELPICMVLFGIARQDGTDTMHVYHPTNITSKEAMAMMKEAVEAAMRGE
jgi:hypothetical protein